MLQSYQGSLAVTCPSLLRFCVTQGTEVTGVVLSLSTVQGTSVGA